MMAPCDQASDMNLTGFASGVGRRAAKKPSHALAGSRLARGPLSTLGLALGYIGLVAILSMAPFVQQAIDANQGQPLVCTDFGGSR